MKGYGLETDPKVRPRSSKTQNLQKSFLQTRASSTPKITISNVFSCLITSYHFIITELTKNCAEKTRETERELFCEFDINSDNDNQRISSFCVILLTDPPLGARSLSLYHSIIFTIRSLSIFINRYFLLSVISDYH